MTSSSPEPNEPVVVDANKVLQGAEESMIVASGHLCIRCRGVLSDSSVPPQERGS
jgi:hypothetical protein